MTTDTLTKTTTRLDACNKGRITDADLFLSVIVDILHDRSGTAFGTLVVMAELASADLDNKKKFGAWIHDKQPGDILYNAYERLLKNGVHTESNPNKVFRSNNIPNSKVITGR